MSDLLTTLTLWMLVVLILAIGRWWRKAPGTGLVLAYVTYLWMIHWVAPALYLLPYYHNFDVQTVQDGLQQSIYGVVAFAAGSLLLSPFVLDLGILPRPTRMRPLDATLPKAYVVIGVLSFVSLSLGAGVIPSATALFSTGQQLVVVGLALGCWHFWRIGDYRKLALWLVFTLLLPFVTVITRGFIGYGAVATLCVLIFLSGFVRSKGRVIVAAVLLAYVGLSVYVTYRRDREDIRSIVWAGQSFQDRFSQLSDTFTNFEWFDVTNPQHLIAIDSRMNQSYLTGLAVIQLASSDDFAHGDTLREAALALIPRAIWADKDIVAGSGNLVSRYTGLTFAGGTSVGIGQVMEFYVNFGSAGVIVGFLIMGMIVTVFDSLAAEYLAKNDLHGFVLWYLPGIALLQVGGSFVEVTASAVASIAVALAANRYLERRGQKDSVGGREPAYTYLHP